MDSLDAHHRQTARVTFAMETEQRGLHAGSVLVATSREQFIADDERRIDRLTASGTTMPAGEDGEDGEDGGLVTTVDTIGMFEASVDTVLTFVVLRQRTLPSRVMSRHEAVVTDALAGVVISREPIATCSVSESVWRAPGLDPRGDDNPVVPCVGTDRWHLAARHAGDHRVGQAIARSQSHRHHHGPWICPDAAERVSQLRCRVARQGLIRQTNPLVLASADPGFRCPGHAQNDNSVFERL